MSHKNRQKKRLQWKFEGWMIVTLLRCTDVKNCNYGKYCMKQFVVNQLSLCDDKLFIVGLDILSHRAYKYIMGTWA